MYKLLIADDDEIICRGLGTCIDWNSQDVEIVGMVYDGEMALEKVREEEPDIVIVDINMPFMDGMEFSSIVRQEYPWIKIIILTAYKEFQYAQQAVQMQVFGYLTKPFSNEEVSAIVDKAIRSLKDEKRYKEEVEKNTQIIRERYLAELTLHGTLDEENRRILPVQSEDSAFQVMVMYIRPLNEQDESLTKTMVEEEVSLHMVTRQVSSYIQVYPNIGIFRQNNRIVFLLEYDSGDAMDAGSLAKELMALIGDEDYVYASCGIGGVYQGIAQIPYSYEEANEAVESRFEYGNRSIIYYGAMKKQDAESALQFHAICDRVQDAVRRKDKQELEAHLDQFIANICRASRISKSTLGLMIMELLLLAYKATEDEKLYEDFFKKSGNLLNRVLKTKNSTEIGNVIRDSFQMMFQFLEDKSISQPERIVQQALDYMKRNHANPDLNFGQVADEVHLSISYLSALMKKYGNINYNQYLTEIRIEHAKKLLMQPDVKAYEAAFLVGFNSSQYFSSCFKKATGMTPREYKEKYDSAGRNS